MEPCIPALAVLAIVAVSLMSWWLIKQPTERVGTRLGEPLYGRAYHWLAGATTAFVVATVHIIIFYAVPSATGYWNWIEENGAALSGVGGFLFLTIGGVLWQSEARSRSTKALFAGSAAVGLVLLLLINLSC